MNFVRMKVQLNRIDGAYQMKAINESGKEGILDGGKGGFTPMQILLAAVASCTVVDIVDILTKQKQDLLDIKVNVEGQRVENAQVKPFKAIQLHYELFGNIEDKKAQRAIELALSKYCSVGASLDPTIEKTFTYKVM